MTENEQKQQLSIAYVHAVAARAGFACDIPPVDDDSVDIRIAARGKVGQRSILLSPRLEIQLKATAQDVLKPEHVSFRLPMKNYDDLRGDTMIPRLLVVLVLPENAEQWLEQTEDSLITRRCAYWLSLRGHPDSENDENITVALPRENQFTVASLKRMMEQVSRKVPL